MRKIDEAVLKETILACFEQDAIEEAAVYFTGLHEHFHDKLIAMRIRTGEALWLGKPPYYFVPKDIQGLSDYMEFFLGSGIIHEVEGKTSIYRMSEHGWKLSLRLFL